MKRKDCAREFIEYWFTDVWPLYESDCDVFDSISDALSNESPFRSEHEAMFSELVDDVEMEARRLCV